jgi:hypothetical protein
MRMMQSRPALPQLRRGYAQAVAASHIVHSRAHAINIMKCGQVMHVA